MSDFNEEKRKIRTQVQTDMGGSGKPPRPITTGTSGGDDDEQNFHQGQRVLVRTYTRRSNGYTVEILGLRISGILETTEFIASGTEMMVTFYKWSESGIALFKPPEEGSTDTKNRISNPARDLTPFFADGSQTSFSSVFGRDKASDYQIDIADLPKCRRKTDLFIPPTKESEYIEHNQDPSTLPNLIPQLKLAEFTGCMFLSNEVFFSRAGILLYKGNCVGAVHSNNFGKSEDQTEVALRIALMEAFDGDALTTTYNLPEELVIPYSSLFLGGSMKVDEYSYGKRYLTYLIESMFDNAATGTLVVAQEESNDLCFIHYLKGVFTGFFTLHEKTIYRDQAKLVEYTSSFTTTKVKASIISDDIWDVSSGFGYDLREYLPKRLS